MKIKAEHICKFIRSCQCNDILSTTGFPFEAAHADRNIKSAELGVTRLLLDGLVIFIGGIGPPEVFPPVVTKIIPWPLLDVQNVVAKLLHTAADVVFQ